MKSLFAAGLVVCVAVSASAGTSVPMWSGTDGTYTYTMVGQSPLTALPSQTTNISVQIIPVALVFSDGTKLDPTAPDNTCSKAGTALSLLEQSPIFNNFAYTVGGTSVGTTQYHDFFQRANFWKYAGPTGVNPNYHVILNPSPHAVTTITVPAADGKTVAAPCGRLGEVNLSWFDTYLENTVIPAAGVLPTQFAVILLYNSVTYSPSTPTSLILGYHSAFSNTSTGGALQTYAVGEFDTTGNYGTTEDVADLSHEIGEWLNDPLGNNPTPAWGNVGQVSGCQSNLEVGDPLSGTNLTITMSNSYVYHLQELAFASWFYHDSPSKGVNGWYSSNGTFKTAAAPCPAPVTPTSTTLTLGATTVPAGTQVSVTIVVKAGTGTAVPAGSVALVTSTGTTLATFSLTNGGVVGSAALPAGTYTVTANYAGNSAFGASNSAPVSVVSTTPRPSVTTLSFSSTSVPTGGTVTATVKVSPSSGTGTPTGTVALVSSTGTKIATITLSSGGFTGSVTLPAGSYTVTAQYSGDVNFTASNSAPVQINPAPLLHLSPTTLTFASTTVGTTATAQTITVSNTGTGPQITMAISDSGADAADFTWTTTCGSSLAAGASCSVKVSFKPAAKGSRTATLTIGGLTESLSGTGK